MAQPAGLDMTKPAPWPYNGGTPCLRKPIHPKDRADLIGPVLQPGGRQAYTVRIDPLGKKAVSLCQSARCDAARRGYHADAPEALSEQVLHSASDFCG